MLHFFPPTVFFDVKAVGYLFSLVCQGSDGVASLYSLRNHGMWKIKDAANNRFIQPLGNAIWARILHRVKTEENLFRDVKSNEAVASSLQLLCWGTQRCFQASHQIICALCGLWVSPVTWGEKKQHTHTIPHLRRACQSASWSQAWKKDKLLQEGPVQSKHRPNWLEWHLS